MVQATRSLTGIEALGFIFPMKKPTEKEIKAQIAALEKCKAFVPRHTMFGDDNFRRIDLQIEYLKGGIDTTSMEFEEFSESEQSAIYEAQNWEEGDSEEDLASGWDIFKKKKGASRK